jgi:hypothetical protein
MPPSEPESEDAKKLFTVASQFKQAGVRSSGVALHAPTSVGARHWTHPQKGEKACFQCERPEKKRALLTEKLVKERKGVLAEGRTQRHARQREHSRAKYL